MNVGLESVGDSEETPTVMSEPGTRVVTHSKPHPRDEGNSLQLGQLCGDYCIGQLQSKGGLGDFGLLVFSITREDTQLTMTGTVMGTPAFASPE